LAAIGVVVLALVASAAAVFTFGLLSGTVLLFAYLNLRRVRRSGVRLRRLAAWVAFSIACIGAVGGYWFWQWVLWDQHYHPGGGGAIPPPTFDELLWMPLVSAGVAVVALGIYAAFRFWSNRTLSMPTPSRSDPLPWKG
jgi:hypothetical protein